MRPAHSSSWFTRFAKATSRLAGRPLTFAVAVAVILAWLVTGPFFRYSDTWQLAINTGTTIVTFLMVFLIQNTQNRDAEAVQVKLDELLRARQGRTTPSWTLRSSRSRSWIRSGPHTRAWPEPPGKISAGGRSTREARRRPEEAE